MTYLNFVSDQFTQFHGIVIPGTLRDSIFILEGLLEQQTSLDPKELMTDTASASDIIFGLFWLLGYQFSPRLADIDGARFWRIDPDADYGPLNDIARHRIKIERIIHHWDDLLRIAGSLKTGVISASELIRSLLQTKRPSALVQALIDLGRISKTIHNLNYINDEFYRRRTLIQINHGESRNGVSRELFLEKRGELRQRYRQGQENQLSALGLVVNSLILWNTIYIEAVLNHLTEQNVTVLPEDVTRLAPLGYDNFNFLGRYFFNLSPEIAHGELRPIGSTENSIIRGAYISK